MAQRLFRSQQRPLDIWPGFVDALGAMLIVVIFLLFMFTLSQAFLGNVLSGKERALSDLHAQVARLATMLSMEEARAARTGRRLGEMSAALEDARERAERQRNVHAAQDRALLERDLELEERERRIATLQNDVTALAELRLTLEKEVAELKGWLDTGAQRTLAERETSAAAVAQVELLNRQVRALREQLAAISRVLGVELSGADEDLSALAERINVALARQARQLALYRSDFFGRLREALGENRNVRVVGDRFVLPAELLFDTGSAALDAGASRQLARLAVIIADMGKIIPADIAWVVQIDGHTDRRPISTAEYPSNWELSAARAIAIVKYLIARGIPAERLAATGFGEHHPLAQGDDEAAYARNRRIEIKLTSR